MSGIEISEQLKKEALAKAKAQTDKYYSQQIEFGWPWKSGVLEEMLPAFLDAKKAELDFNEEQIVEFQASIIKEFLKAGAFTFIFADGAKETITKKDEDIQIPLLGSDMYENSEIIRDKQNSILICNGRAYLYSEETFLEKGENSAVFKAVDLESGEEVVLKRQSKDKADLDSLKNENEIANNYKVGDTVYGKGLASMNDDKEESYFLIQKFVAGKTLNKFKTNDSIQLAKDVVAAVKDFQKQTGTMHRDLRPENIMVTNEGMVVPLDPGAASKISPNGLATRPLGYTPGYTHPFIIVEIYNSGAEAGNYEKITLDESKKSDAEYLESLSKKLPKNTKGEIKFEGILLNPQYSEEHEVYALQKVLESIPGLKDVFDKKVMTSFDQIDKVLEGLGLNNQIKKSDDAAGVLLSQHKRKNFDPSKKTEILLLRGINEAVQEFHTKNKGNCTWKIDDFVIFDKGDEFIVCIKNLDSKIEESKKAVKSAERDEVKSLAQVFNKASIGGDGNMQLVEAISGKVKTLDEFYKCDFGLKDEMKEMDIASRAAKLQTGFAETTQNASEMNAFKAQKPVVTTKSEFEGYNSSSDDDTLSTSSESSNNKKEGRKGKNFNS